MRTSPLHGGPVNGSRTPELNLVLFGPPGAGKGTQAKPLAAERGLHYVATGDLLRRAVATESQTGREVKRYMEAGELVPDDLVFRVLVDALGIEDAPYGFLFDGFPRTTRQADALDGELERRARPVAEAILLEVPDELLVERLSGRRICVAHGHEYHVEHRPPLDEGRCDVDGSELVRRDDDDPATIRRRLAVYHEHTEPLIAHYAARDRLHHVDGDGDPARVHRRVLAAISHDD
jgi:adenylate kinase